MVNFWATWCGPCREEMPLLSQAAAEWKQKGIVFLSVSLDETSGKASIPGFLSKYGIHLPVWTGGSVDDLEKYRLGNGIPDTMFVDEQGTIVFRVLGEIRRAELDERLHWLTSGRQSPGPAAVISHMPVTK